jgi:hypothetical protein
LSQNKTGSGKIASNPQPALLAGNGLAAGKLQLNSTIQTQLGDLAPENRRGPFSRGC